ncbi:HAD family hydrolase [Petroclostridium sp. X23]|uniref:HAD family hydrolase n=1 Tax=Petroclostridium sp. X23 TaxID=3045146 RepID=UPI0024ACE814|nr:HAD family hydrolase [Petroclostridium sp. X23]WHH59375.1 HAD family hydrolase [Petroclostridium sp. X23]
MINTFLFDLDGTLLPLDMDRFMKLYFDELGKCFSDMISPEVLYKYIWESTEAMVTNTDYRTNEEVFMDKFSSLIDGNIETYQSRFDAFYDHEFLNVKASVQSMPLIKECISILKEKSYELVVATNPLFPKKAILHRIVWAGLDPKDFTYITSYENNHYCKPQIKYYEEILNEIKKSPEQCIMVGNDVQEDLIASKLGVKTYLITDNMIHRSKNDFITDYKGTYQEFYDYVCGLDPVSDTLT